MIDIHCHIIPGVDDGASNLDEALEMARIAYADGIRHIVATPHFAKSYQTNRDDVTRGVKRLNKALKEAAISVEIHPGHEVRIESSQYFYDHAKNETFHYLGSTGRYLLLEQKWSGYNNDSPEIVRWLLDRGVQPIIPHPERHTFFRQQPELLTRLIELGAWTQVSVDSLLGKNSEVAKTFGEWLIQTGNAHTIATDAHNPRRKPNLSLGFNIVRRLAGESEVQAILTRLQGIIET